MDLLKASLGIKRTIQNAARMREIVSVLARNGFDEFIIKSGAHTALPGFVLPKSRITERLSEFSEDDWPRLIGYRLRKSFEELGPGFVKFGQLLATREDLFDPAFIREMKMLQNEVKGIEFAVLKESIEKSLESKVGDVFQYIDESPIGTASIANVYRAKLISGEDVVVKVRRPGIVSTIETDFSILTILVGQLERISDEIKYMGLSRVIEDFGKSLQLELDFRIEGLNNQRLKQNLEKLDDETLPFYIPKVFREYSREDILVMEYLDGTAFNKLVFTDEAQKKDVFERLMRGVHVFVHTLLADGFFHADLHGGNFLLLSDGQIGIIDFGLMGNLSQSTRTNLIAILYSLVTNNYENLVYEFLDVAEYEEVPDQDALIRDIKECLAPFVGLSIKETNISFLIRAIVTTLGRHKLFLPREWFIIFRALITLDGVGKSLDFDLNIFEIIDNDIHDLIGEAFNKEEIMGQALWGAKDVLTSLRIIPRHLRWYLKEMSRNNYENKLQIRGLRNFENTIMNSFNFLSLSIVTSVLIHSGVTTMGDVKDLGSWRDIPIISWVFFVLASILFIRGFVFSTKYFRFKK
jgi:ubiquinone biosynthesis protein